VAVASDCSSLLKSSLQAIIDGAKPQVASARELQAVFEKSSTLTVEYFGEDPSKVKIDDLLASFSQFFKIFAQTLTDIAKQRQIQEKAAAKASPGGAAKLKGADSPSIAQRLMEQLKSGAVLREQKLPK